LIGSKKSTNHNNSQKPSCKRDTDDSELKRLTPRKKHVTSGKNEWKYEEVKKLFNIEFIPSSRFVEHACNGKVLEKHTKIAKDICSIWQHKIKVMGPLTSGPDLQRNLFIGDLLCLSISKLKIKATLRIESNPSSMFNRPVEFVVSIDMQSVLLIVETKRDDIDQGRAQLLMQLYGCLKENSGFNVFGFVSNAASWTPIVYTKDGKFFEGDTLSVSALHPEASEIANIVRLVEFMMTEGRTIDITDDDEEEWLGRSRVLIHSGLLNSLV
jgi:hypothetical protein